MKITLNDLLNRLTSEQLIKTLTTEEIIKITGDKKIEYCVYKSFNSDSLKFKFVTTSKEDGNGFITNKEALVWIGDNGELKGEVK